MAVENQIAIERGKKNLRAKMLAEFAARNQQAVADTQRIYEAEDNRKAAQKERRKQKAIANRHQFLTEKFEAKQVEVRRLRGASLNAVLASLDYRRFLSQFAGLHIYGDNQSEQWWFNLDEPVTESCAMACRPARLDEIDQEKILRRAMFFRNVFNASYLSLCQFCKIGNISDCG